MGLYSRYILPHIVDAACGASSIMRQRMKLVPLARGRILEVGIGSGRNLGFYDPSRVMKVWGLDPSSEMVNMARGPARDVPFEVEFLLAGSEEIPLETGSVDTVMLTYTLCTIPDGVSALREMARVLAPGGKLLFCEHGLAPDPGVRRWQRWANPVWRRVGGGCNLDRDVPALLRQGGFDVQGLETMYIPGWRPAAFNYWGAAVPAR